MSDDDAQFYFSPSTPPKPVISNVTPTAGTPIAKDQAVSFDVLSTEPLAALVVGASMLGAGLDDTVWRKEGFTPFYAAGSTRVSIVGGYRFRVVRRGGWPTPPTFHVDAIDTYGAKAGT